MPSQGTDKQRKFFEPPENHSQIARRAERLRKLVNFFQQSFILRQRSLVRLSQRLFGLRGEW